MLYEVITVPAGCDADTLCSRNRRRQRPVLMQSDEQDGTDHGGKGAIAALYPSIVLIFCVRQAWLKRAQCLQ